MTDLKMFKTLFVVFCLLLFEKSLFGFTAQPFAGEYSTTHTHRDKTHRGVGIAVSTFLKNNGIAKDVFAYFGSGKFTNKL